ncbi:DUF502 domain-containing protein [Fibrella aquatica]|uniref:DUF502 domain-containing protein n=1 Tax=Fibrella aquatica TaxID=3242487 RepID=UPI0035214658
MTNKFTSRLLAYFGRGLLAIAPLGLTIYMLYGVFVWVDGLVPFHIPGIGFLIMTGIILASGLLISTVIPQSVASLFEGSIRHLPLVSLIYFSVKDLISAFVGDKKKFNQPVLVMMNRESGIQKIGFITQTDLSHFNLSDSVMVYCPHSYAFSGELYIVPAENIRLLNLSSAEAMKLIVSGGVSK